MSSDANELSEADKKTTIGPEHVMRALERLGFGSLQERVQACWDEWKAVNKGARCACGGLSWHPPVFHAAVRPCLVYLSRAAGVRR